MSRRSALPGLATICLLLQACGSTPPAPPLAEGQQDEVAAPVVVLPADPTAYETAQRARAAALERDGRLADAALVWEVLATIRPRHPDYPLRLAELKRRIASEAAERLQRGDQAAAAGQLDAAMSHYLSALAVQPDNAKAADALRSAERERNRRNHLGKLSRHTLTRKAMADGDMVPLPMAAPPATTSVTAPPPSIASLASRAAVPQAQSAAPAPPASRAGSTLDRIEVEHASLLASQGEFDEAVAMLENWLRDNRRDDAARRLLADVYLQQAESLAASKPAAAIAVLEKSLQLERNQPRVAERLKQLKASARR
ncbi:hypothetical protein [Piscinibacter sakaiensis]|uniref:hypothetical protein n=1 Tax=Piscinibacter sakaiensis TaxID=1547922 RepID=UPI003AAFACF5